MERETWRSPGSEDARYRIRKADPDRESCEGRIQGFFMYGLC